MMLKRFIPIFLVFPLFLGCVTTPVTERRSLVLIPFDQEVKLGEEAYQEILKKEKKSNDGQLIEIVERVGATVGGGLSHAQSAMGVHSDLIRTEKCVCPARRQSGHLYRHIDGLCQRGRAGGGDGP